MKICQIVFLALLACALIAGTVHPVLAEQNTPLQLLPDASAPSGKTSGPSVDHAAPVFHDIRGPVMLAETPAFLVPVLVGVGLLGGFLGWYWWRRRKKAAPLPLPHEVALAELAAFRAAIHPEETRQQAARLAEILRRYMEARFVLPVTRQTTREFFTDISGHPAVLQAMDEHRRELQTCLELADFAKFALRVPVLSDLESMESAVRVFVESSSQVSAQQGRG